MQQTINTMKTNIETANVRGERLDNLQDKTDNLAQSAQGFRRGANRVRKQMWWKDMKMRMCIIAGIIILILIIVIPSKLELDRHRVQCLRYQLANPDIFYSRRDQEVKNAIRTLTHDDGIMAHYP